MIDRPGVHERAVAAILRKAPAVVIQRRKHRRTAGSGIAAPVTLPRVFGQRIDNDPGMLHHPERVLHLETQRRGIGHVPKAFHIVEETFPVRGKINRHRFLPSSAIPSDDVPFLQPP